MPHPEQPRYDQNRRSKRRKYLLEPEGFPKCQLVQDHVETFYSYVVLGRGRGLSRILYAFSDYISINIKRPFFPVLHRFKFL